MDKKKGLCFQASLSELEKAKNILENTKELSIDFNNSIFPILGDLNKQDLLDEVEAYRLAISAIEMIQKIKTRSSINIKVILEENDLESFIQKIADDTTFITWV